MTKSSVIRWSGLAAILTGLLGIGEGLLGEDPGPAFIWVYLLTNLVTYIALIGILTFQRPEADLWTWVGFGVAMIANTLFFFDNFLEIAGGIYALGLILMAIGVLRVGKLPGWVAYLWILAPVVGIPGYLVQGLGGIFIILGSAAYGLAFIMAGYKMWQETGRMVLAT
jgi:hypothetical protein